MAATNLSRAEAKRLKFTRVCAGFYQAKACGMLWDLYRLESPARRWIWRAVAEHHESAGKHFSTMGETQEALREYLVARHYDSDYGWVD